MLDGLGYPLAQVDGAYGANTPWAQSMSVTDGFDGAKRLSMDAFYGHFYGYDADDLLK